MHKIFFLFLESIKDIILNFMTQALEEKNLSTWSFGE